MITLFFISEMLLLQGGVTVESNCTWNTTDRYAFGVLNDLTEEAENVTSNKSIEFGNRTVDVSWVYLDLQELYHIVRGAHNLHRQGIDLIIVNSSDESTLKIISNFQNTPTIDVHDVDKIEFDHVIDKSTKQACDNGNDQLAQSETTYDVTVTTCNTLSLVGDLQEKVLIGEMVASIVRNLRWSVVIIFYETQTEHLMDIISTRISNEGIFKRIYNVDGMNETAFKQMMNKIYDSMVEDVINVTIVCGVPCVERIITKADGYDMEDGNVRRTSMRDHSSWFIVTKSTDDTHGYISNKLTLDNVFVLDLAIPVKEQVLTPASTANTAASMDYLFSTLLNVSHPEGNETIGNALSSVKSQFERVFGIRTCLTYQLSTLMWVSHDNGASLARQFDIVGHVNIIGEIILCRKCHMFPNKYFGLNQRKWLVTTRWWPPFTERVQVNGTTVDYMGFCTDLLRELMTELNFTHEWTEPADGEWGTLMDNGSWTGMIGQLERRDVDLMVGAISIQADREQVMDFTHPFYYDVSTIMMKRPHGDESKILTLIKPFKWQVYVVLVIVLPASAIGLCLIERASPYYRLHGREGRQSFQMSFWYMLGALLSQGGESLPNSISGRTMISSFWLFSILFVGTYCGNLIAFLTVSIEKPPFQSMQEMIDQDGYKWGTLGGTYFITWFSRSKLSILQEVWKGIKEYNESDPRVLHTDPNVHINKILTEKYVYLGDKVYMDFRTSNDCRLMTADEEFPNMQYGVGLPNNSLYTRLFSNKILELHESGIFQIFKQKHWPMKQICPGSLTQSAEEINLVDIQSAFYLLGIGISLAVLSLSSEFLIKWWKIRWKGLVNKDPCRHIRTTSTVDLEEYAVSVVNGECENRHIEDRDQIHHTQNGSAGFVNEAFDEGVT